MFCPPNTTTFISSCGARFAFDILPERGLHTGEAVMKAPVCDPSDFCIALHAECTDRSAEPISLLDRESQSQIWSSSFQVAPVAISRAASPKSASRSFPSSKIAGERMAPRYLLEQASEVDLGKNLYDAHPFGRRREGSVRRRRRNGRGRNLAKGTGKVVAHWVIEVGVIKNVEEVGAERESVPLI